jgi:predicted nucleic acid-binding protein
VSTYVDASVVLRLALSQPGAIAADALLEPGIASELVQLECLRSLDRLRLAGALPDEHMALARRRVMQVLDALTLVRIDPVVLDLAARPLPAPLGTLDAIHLATALLWRDAEDSALTLATHDRALGLAAQAFAFEVVGLT